MLSSFSSQDGSGRGVLLVSRDTGTKRTVLGLDWPRHVRMPRTFTAVCGVGWGWSNKDRRWCLFAHEKYLLPSVSQIAAPISEHPGKFHPYIFLQIARLRVSD